MTLHSEQPIACVHDEVVDSRLERPGDAVSRQSERPRHDVGARGPEVTKVGLDRQPFLHRLRIRRQMLDIEP